MGPFRFAAVVLLALTGSAVGQDRNAPAIDTDAFIFRQIEDGKPPPRADENPEEFRAYNEVLLHARRFPQSELAAAARHDLLFRDLVVETREQFRLQLVSFDGRLIRLREIGPTRELAEAGVTTLYEAWVFPDRTDVPICVLLTELPAGLPPRLLYDPAPRVTAAGYFFKLLRYESDSKDPKSRHRLAPLLMAHSLTVLPNSPAVSASSADVVTLVVGLVAAVSAAVLGLVWYFRRGDRAARSARRERENPFDDTPAV